MLQLGVPPANKWACSAVGSAPEWHSGGHRFDPGQVHHLPRFARSLAAMTSLRHAATRLRRVASGHDPGQGPALERATVGRLRQASGYRRLSPLHRTICNPSCSAQRDFGDPSDAARWIPQHSAGPAACTIARGHVRAETLRLHPAKPRCAPAMPAQIQRRTVARYESNAGPKASRNFDSSRGMMNH